jgi:hypothetical protein
MKAQNKQQSNPFSTGDGGGNFESRVQSAFTVLMLTGSVVPCLPAWPIQQIKLQGKYAGFNTDDFIAYVQDPQTHAIAKLLAQIKHSVSITKGNEIFSDVMAAAWKDFNNPDVFTEGVDAIALITCQLSALDINHVRPLMEWARHCVSAQEFFTKVSTPMFSSETKKEKLKAFRTQLQAANAGADISDETVWRFLKSFYLISYDLDEDAGSTQALLFSLLKQNTTEESVENLWLKIIGAVQSANQNAATLTLTTIPENIRTCFNPTTNPTIKRDIIRLHEHGDLILDGIRSDIAGLHIDRKDIFLELLDAADAFDFILVTGARGNGKSGIVREFARFIGSRFPAFCLRTEDINKPHLDQVFTSIGLRGTLSELSSFFALMPRKYLLIESIEKLLELEYRTAFDDLLNFVRQSGGWTIIASGRDYAFQQITLHYLKPKNMKWTHLPVPEFTDNEVDILLDKIETIRPLGFNLEIRKILRNPFMAGLAVRVVDAGAHFSEHDGEAAFRSAVWRDVISFELDRKDGLPARRKQTFIDVAVKRAKAMVYGVPETDFDPAALFKLEADHLIRRDQAKCLVSPAHDILEDWALVEFIETHFRNNTHDIHGFVNSVGFEPAMNRAFRLWLHQRLRCEPNSDETITLIVNVIRGQIPYWQEEAITAVFMGDNPLDFLRKLSEQLFENNGELLKRFCFILRISCKAPNINFIKQFVGDIEQNELAESLWLMPYGIGWEALILFLFENISRVTENLFPYLTAVLDEWSSSININQELPNPAREAGLLALHLLEFVKTDYNCEDNRKKLLGVIIRVIQTIVPEFQSLLDRDVFNISDHSGWRKRVYVRQLLPMALINIETMFLCKHCPDLLIKLAWHTWLINDDKSERYHPDVEECFGLHEHREGADFFPASGAKGPFRHLLACHPRMALDFILALCNQTAEKYAHSRLDSNDEESFFPTHYPVGVTTVEIHLNDGTKVTQYCSHRLWCGYRGTAVLPYLLQSALMAFENWLIFMAKEIDNTKNLEWIFDYVLRNSNSVMPTAVLASIATGFPDKLGRAALPLLRTPALYEWDLIRCVQESGALGAGYKPGDPLWKVYAKERKAGNQCPWRRENLEHLATRLQLTELRDEIFSIIDGVKENISTLCKDKDDDAWRFRLHRMDVRGWEAKDDSENNRILLGPTEPEPDLKERQQEHQKDMMLRNRFMSLFLWSEKTFNNEKNEHTYYLDWREAFNDAKALMEILKKGEADEVLRMHSGGIVKATAIFIRDHTAELTDEDIEWCACIVIDVVLSHARSDNHQVMYDKTGLDGSVAAAQVLPILYGYTENDEERSKFKGLIAIAITHVNDSVRRAIAEGIRKYLWQRCPEVAQACIDAALENARLKQIEIKWRYKKHSRHKQKEGKQLEPELSENWQDEFIQKVMTGELSTINTISWETHSAWYLLPPFLMIPDASTRPAHISLITQMISMLSDIEVSERNHHSGSDDRIKMPDDLEVEFTKRFADYLLTISEAEAQFFVDLLNSKCESAPDFIHWLFVCLLSTADKQNLLEKYWDYWNKLSASIEAIAIKLSGKTIKTIRNDYRTKLVRGMFFSDIEWNIAKPEGYLIEPGLEHICRFAENAGINPLIFEAMSRFLFYLPNVFMPRGLNILIKHQRNVGGTHLLGGTNTVYYLERVLQRLLLRDQNTFPSSKQYRDDLLVLLNAMMETGSSTAYFLRERLLQMKLNILELTRKP